MTITSFNFFISELKISHLYLSWDMCWRNGLCAKLRIERSEFELWPEHCVLFLDKARYSGFRRFYAGVNPTMDSQPIQGGVEMFVVLLATETQAKLRLDGPLDLYAGWFSLFINNKSALCFCRNRHSDNSVQRSVSRAVVSLTWSADLSEKKTL